MTTQEMQLIPTGGALGVGDEPKGDLVTRPTA